MLQNEFESYLTLLARCLRLSHGQRDTIARELRGHMEDRLEDLMAQGRTREEAISTILDEFGDAAVLAAEFGRIGRRRRWIMRSAGTIVTIAAAVLITSFLLPEHRAGVPAPAASLAGHDFSLLLSSSPSKADLQQPIRVIGESEADRQARDRLNAVVTLQFKEGSAFEEVVIFLRDTTKANISVNWNALNLAGIDKTTDTMGLELRDVSAATALASLLERIGGAVGQRLGFAISGGVIEINTMDNLNNNPVVRVYDCRELIKGTDTELLALSVLINSPGQATTRPSGPEAGTPARGPAEQVCFVRHNEAEGLLVLVRTTVPTDTWQNGPGERGSIAIYDGLLVVRQSYPVQEKIAGLLEMLREAKLARTGVKASTDTAELSAKDTK